MMIDLNYIIGAKRHNMTSNERVSDLFSWDQQSLTHQVRRSRERVCLAAAGLTVAEARGRKSVDGHVDEAPDPGVLQDVLLTRLGLEHHIKRERFQLVRLLLGELEKIKSMNFFNKIK